MKKSSTITPIDIDSLLKSPTIDSNIGTLISEICTENKFDSMDKCLATTNIELLKKIRQHLVSLTITNKRKEWLAYILKEKNIHFLILTAMECLNHISNPAEYKNLITFIKPDNYKDDELKKKLGWLEEFVKDKYALLTQRALLPIIEGGGWGHLMAFAVNKEKEDLFNVLAPLINDYLLNNDEIINFYSFLMRKLAWEKFRVQYQYSPIHKIHERSLLEHIIHIGFAIDAKTLDLLLFDEKQCKTEDINSQAEAVINKYYKRHDFDAEIIKLFLENKHFNLHEKFCNKEIYTSLLKQNDKIMALLLTSSDLVQYLEEKNQCSLMQFLIKNNLSKEIIFLLKQESIDFQNLTNLITEDKSDILKKELLDQLTAAKDSDYFFRLFQRLFIAGIRPKSLPSFPKNDLTASYLSFFHSVSETCKPQTNLLQISIPDKAQEIFEFIFPITPRTTTFSKSLIQSKDKDIADLRKVVKFLQGLLYISMTQKKENSKVKIEIKLTTQDLKKTVLPDDKDQIIIFKSIMANIFTKNNSKEAKPKLKDPEKKSLSLVEDTSTNILKNHLFQLIELNHPTSISLITEKEKGFVRIRFDDIKLLEIFKHSINATSCLHCERLEEKILKLTSQGDHSEIKATLNKAFLVLQENTQSPKTEAANTSTPFIPGYSSSFSSSKTIVSSSASLIQGLEEIKLNIEGLLNKYQSALVGAGLARSEKRILIKLHENTLTVQIPNPVPETLFNDLSLALENASGANKKTLKHANYNEKPNQKGKNKEFAEIQLSFTTSKPVWNEATLLECLIEFARMATEKGKAPQGDFIINPSSYTSDVSIVPSSETANAIAPKVDQSLELLLKSKEAPAFAKAWAILQLAEKKSTNLRNKLIHRFYLPDVDENTLKNMLDDIAQQLLNSKPTDHIMLPPKVYKNAWDDDTSKAQLEYLLNHLMRLTAPSYLIQDLIEWGSELSFTITAIGELFFAPKKNNPKLSETIQKELKDSLATKPQKTLFDQLVPMRHDAAHNGENEFIKHTNHVVEQISEASGNHRNSYYELALCLTKKLNECKPGGTRMVRGN